MFANDLDSSQSSADEDELSFYDDEKARQQDKDSVDGGDKQEKVSSIRDDDEKKSDSFTRNGYSFLDENKSIDGKSLERDRREENDDEIDSKGEPSDGLLASKRVVVRDIEMTEVNVDNRAFPREFTTRTEREPERDSHLGDDDSSQDSWNVLTKLDAEQVFPFNVITCTPSATLQRSLNWGNPVKYLQISNFSAQWRCEVFWIDEDGAMILREDVKQGNTHFELCGEDHVWAVVASSLVAANTNRSNRSVNSSQKHVSGMMDSVSLVSLSQHSHSTATPSVGLSETPPIVMLFHPVQGALQDGKCAALLWRPWTSLSVSQTIYSKTSKLGSVSRGEQRIEPAIHIQLFDSAKEDVQTRVSQQHPMMDGESDEAAVAVTMMAEIDLGKLKRRPLRKSRNGKM